MKRKPAYLALLLTAILLPLAFSSITAAQSNTSMYVYPQTSTASPGQSFSVSINIANVVELNAWQFWLNWSANVLDFVDVAEGPFLNSSGAYASFFVAVKPGDPRLPNNSTVYVADTLKGAPRQGAPNGSGTLATVTFRVKTEGVTSLHFMQEPPLKISKLINWDQQLIPHSTEDGYFDSSYVPPPPQTHQLSYDELLANYNSLKDDYDSLNNKYETLQATYNSLSTNHSSLQTDYDELESKYNALTSELETFRNLNYLLIATAIIFIATTVLFAVRKPKTR